MSGVSGGDVQPDSVATTAVVLEQDEREASTSGSSETGNASKTPCAFYMRTGTCAYVSFLHLSVLLVHVSIVNDHTVQPACAVQCICSVLGMLSANDATSCILRTE